MIQYFVIIIKQLRMYDPIVLRLSTLGLDSIEGKFLLN